MKHDQQTTYSERLSAAAEAKKALLAKFQPKPTVTAPNLVDRATQRAQELEAVRQARVAQREEARAARAAAEEAARQAAFEAEQATLEAKRNERKERKQLMKQDAQGRRAARLEAYSRV